MSSQPSSEETWPAVQASVPQRLVLTWGAHEMEVTEKRPYLTVGRDELSDLLIKTGNVSRLHARIDYRNGHFSLTDRSSNGTYVADSAGTTCKVIRETYVLLGAGTISFGVDPETSSKEMIRYAVKF